MGGIGNPRLRWTAEPGSRLAALRQEAHTAFDPYWQFSDGAVSRRRAYRWLAKQMGLSEDHCHFGMFGEKQLEQAIHICRTSKPS